MVLGLISSVLDTWRTQCAVPTPEQGHPAARRAWAGRSRAHEQASRSPIANGHQRRHPHGRENQRRGTAEGLPSQFSQFSQFSQ